MATLRLRAGAVGDLQAILAYSVEQHGIARAEMYLSDIDHALDRLREFPEIGEPRSDLGPGWRSFPVREHRLFYRFAAGHISVARVLHKAMDPARWLS
jgi:toxin ParE1/3/4